MPFTKSAGHVFGYSKGECHVEGSDFSLGRAALDFNDVFLHDTSAGNLFCDADGSGAQFATPFATLSNHPTLAAGRLNPT
jgi:Ca2+-binding RTX toxin-like protein